MFTLVVCLVVVALSGAAVLHIVLSDAPQRATLRAPPRRDRPAGPAPRSTQGRELVPDHVEPAQQEPQPAEESSPPPEAAPRARPGGEGASVALAPPRPDPPASPVVEPPSDEPLGGWPGQGEAPVGSRLRSAALLVVFLASVGGLVAVVVVVLLVLAAVALRGALG